jgi:hypothetical protein
VEALLRLTKGLASQRARIVYSVALAEVHDSAPLSLVGGHPRARGFKTMRLLRTAFWLGITIYYLPNTNSQPISPQISLNSSQCRYNKAADTGRLCAWVSESDTDPPRGVIKRGERERSSSRETLMHSQSTLTRSDLAVPWRGSAAGKEHDPRRPI